MCLSTSICCPRRAYGSIFKQLWPSYVGQILGFWVTCGVKMMSLPHGLAWQPTQPASGIHIKHVQCLRTLVCSPWAYSSSHKQLYPHYLAHILGFWVTCGVKMMSLGHGWGWQPPKPLLPTSTIDIYKVFEHIDMLSMSIWQYPQTVIRSEFWPQSKQNFII